MITASLFTITCGSMFLLLACAGYAIFPHAAPSLQRLAGSAAKADLKSLT